MKRLSIGIGEELRVLHLHDNNRYIDQHLIP